MNAVSYTPRYPSWDRFRPMLFKISLAISILLCFCVMNVEAVAPTYKPYEVDIVDSPFISATPATIHEKKVVPPPTPPDPPKAKELIPTKIETVEKIEKSVEEKIFKDPEVEVEFTGSSPVELQEVAPVVDIVEKQDVIDDKLWDFVDQMPIFGDCSLDDYSGKELRNCSDIALLNFIQENLKYPSLERSNGIEGTVIVQFVVDKYGAVSNVTIAREPNKGLGKAAKKIMESLPNWKPGKQNGRPVKVLYTVPVKFKLN